MSREEHYEKVKANPLYRYFTNEINRLDYEINNTKRELSKLSEKQIEQKRGRTELAKLRKLL